MKNSIRNIFSMNIIVFISLLAACAETKTEQPFTQLPYSTPESQGTGSESILRFLEATAAENLEMHSFMYIRHGYIIADAWWEPYRSDVNHIMHSVSKTFTSTAIGFAVDEKRLTVDDKVISFFPEDLPPELSPYLKELSVKHLLMMSVGHETPPVFYITDENWVKRFLMTPVVNRPGSVFSYSSYASYMLSAILQKVTGQSMFEYLKPRLFEPLGMNDIQWETGAEGIVCGGWGMQIKTSDMAKLGQFYLQEGVWNGKQLLSASWIKAATSARICQIQNPTGEQKLHDEGAQGYGYQIWRCTHNAYRADGAEGQYILVMPDQDAVIAVTSRVPNMHRILKLVWQHLLPGMLDHPLRANEDAGEFLVSKTSSLHIPYPFFTDEERVTPLKSQSQRFTFEANEQQMEAVSFHFDEKGDCKLTLQISGCTYDYCFGLDSWRYGSSNRPGPYFLNPRRNPEGLAPFAVAGYFSWTAPGEISLRLLYLTETQDETCICRFQNNQLNIHLSNSMQPGKPPVVLTGHLQ
ncbi:MAG: beta-lactamase family protein [Tannerella sp.]|jgi:hypothetical protein|nr:beta-lactamase family protein [Tannerella sp.]